MAILKSPYQYSDPNADIQPAKLPPAPELPEDGEALKLVLKDLNRGEYYQLAKGMTVEWDKDDRLYLFRLPQAFWEGSSVPRSNLGIPLIYEHIESLMPQVMNSLFSDNPPFEVEPRPKTSGEAARAVRSLLTFQLEDMRFQEEARLGIKEALLYGTTYWKWGWEQYPVKTRKYKRAGAPKLEQTQSGPVKLPTAESLKVKEEFEEVLVSRPKIEQIHIRHIVPDPGCRFQDIRTGKWVIHRMYMTLMDLEKLRTLPDYKLPEKDELAALWQPPQESPERSLLEGRSTSSVMNTGVTALDINMELKAMPRWQNNTSDPTLQPLEVVEYWTDERCIVVLNRKLVIKNSRNDFHRLPFLSINYASVPDSFYGIGIGKLLSGEQRLQQGVINSRLDDLALRLSGTFLRKRGGNTPTQQLRLRPGGIIDSDDEKGVQMIQYPPAITDAFAEIDASDNRSQRRTGASEIITSGTAPKQGQVGRTAAGMQTLSAGVGSRMAYFIDNVSNMFFVPALEAFHEMNSRWLSTDDIERILSEELAESFEQDAIEVKNARLKFKVLAGTKLRAKSAMAQNLPEMMNLLSSAPVLDAMQDHEMHVDWKEIIDQYFDVSGWPGEQSIVVKNTQEDKQRMAAKSQAAQTQNLEAQKHRQRVEEIQSKGITQAGVKLIEELLESHDPERQLKAVELLRQMAGQPPAEGGEQPQGPEQGQPGGMPGAGGGQ